MNNKKFTEITEEYVEEIYKTATEVFCNGIYIKSDNHPCGWDFIDFNDIYIEIPSDILESEVPIEAFSGGNYRYHEFEDKTLLEIIRKVGMNGWCYEVSGVDGLK